jgi:hypothetical protein
MMSDYHVTYPIAIAIACALAFGVTLFAVALGHAFGRDQDLITPAMEQGEQLRAYPIGPGEFKPDLAWPFYPYRQSKADLARVRDHVARLNGTAWRPGKAFFGGGAGWWVLTPIPVVTIAFLLVVSLASWFCYLVYLLVNVVSASVSLVLLVPASAILNGVERSRRIRKLTQAACMQCFHVTPWPAYQCPACLRPHHDVRPGRLGLLTRRCQCGTHLPTRASRAAWAVTPLCKRCSSPLPTGAGAVRDVRIPVFGDVSAGKTRFLYASLNSLMVTARQARRDVSLPDEVSRSLGDFGLSVIRSGQETAKTSTNAQVTLTCQLGTGRQSDLVHLFDAAGEHFRSARDPSTLRFLDEGHGLVYVLDPFSVDEIKKQLGERGTAALARAHAAAGDPELTYDEVVSRLRDSGVPASTQKLAVVVSKADLLRSAGLRLPADSDAIAQWLWDIGVHNLVMSARHEFAEVRFFTVASQNVPPGGFDDPGAPLRWLLTSHGVRLPAYPADESGIGQSGRFGHRRPADPDSPLHNEPAEARS